MIRAIDLNSEWSMDSYGKGGSFDQLELNEKVLEAYVKPVELDLKIS